jgi:CzcA family heavy metal efflux pump
MTRLISTALRLRVLVLAIAVVVIGLGVRTVFTVPYDVFPEFAPPLIEVQTEAPGLSIEDVEQLVTAPIESAMNGTARLETMRSKSVLGLSSVVLILPQGTDVLAARREVQERLAHVAGQLPVVARAPVLIPPHSSTSRTLKIGMSSASLTQAELTALARWTVRPRLMAIPGVSNVAIWGQRDQELQVVVDPDRLRAHGVTLDAVVRAASSATVIGAGGFVDTPNQRLAVRHLPSIQDATDLARTVVAFRNGAALSLGDVARVEIGSPPAIGDAVINDRPGLLLVIEKQPSGNTLEVTRKIEAALQAMKPGLSGVDIDLAIFRPATFIDRSLENLGRAVLIGCLLVIAVLIFFMADWRSAAISMTAIPLSLLAAGIVLHLWGGTLNTMVLAGLLIAVGVVVDDAIIDVENIARRLQLNRAAAHPETPLIVVLRASIEVRSAVVFGSLIVVLVCVPVLLLPGVAGAFFRPLAVAYVLAIVASLLVALTVTPVLALLLLPSAPERRADPWLTRKLKASYLALFPRLLESSRWVIAVLLIGVALAAATVPWLGQEFLPRFKERDFLMHWVGKPGASLETMRRITLRVNEDLRAIAGVRSVGAHIGRAEAADEVVGSNFAEIWLSVDDEVDYDDTVGRIQGVLERYPGIQRDVLTYLRERIKEVLTGASATMVVRIYGPELAELRRKAEEVQRATAEIPGVGKVQVESQTLVPQIQMRARPETAALIGISPGDLWRATSTLVHGTTVGQVFRDQRVYDVTVRGSDALRTDLEALRGLPIDASSGAQVSLGDVADIRIVPAPNEIKHEAASRRIDVLFDLAAGGDLGAVARAIETKVSQLQFAAGYHPDFVGEYAAREESRRRLFALAGLAVVGIVLLLYVDFRSVRLTLLVCTSLPFALIGGLVGALIAGGTLSLGSLVGFVTVLGIAARNAIMLLSHYRHLQMHEGEPFGRRLVVRGAVERLVPILMTASCTALALLPIVLAGDIPGHEIDHPMAVVIVSGLVSSTVLNLLVMPALYARFGEATGSTREASREQPLAARRVS